jgi:hypothetical protein
MAISLSHQAASPRHVKQGRHVAPCAPVEAKVLLESLCGYYVRYTVTAPPHHHR